jgi:predicted nucleotidyltransferase
MKIRDKYRKAVDEFVERVLDKYSDRIDSIILFGSVARGEAKEESDIDILIKMKPTSIVEARFHKHIPNRNKINK